MPTYRVTEITDVEADSEEEAIKKAAGNLDGEVVTQSAEPVRAGRPEGQAGCPECGSYDIQVMASAVGNVELLGLEKGHIDEVEWGVLEDVDIIEASSFKCYACEHRQDVGGDNELYDALGLRWF